MPKLRTLYLHAAALGPQLTSSQSTALSAVTSADGGLTDSMKQRETILILFVALLRCSPPAGDGRGGGLLCLR